MDEKKLMDYLHQRRKDYIENCELDEERMISEMKSGKAYVKNCARIHLEKNETVTLSPELLEDILNSFRKEEKEKFRKK